MSLFVGGDVGSPEKAGSTSQVDSGFTVTAGGTDIWGLSDQFHFAYTAWQGDFDIKVRLESLEEADLYTKAGIMARESLEPDSPHAFLVVFPDNSSRNKNNGGYEFQYREMNQGDSAAIYPEDYKAEPPAFPVNYPHTWLRLQRIGDEFIASYSAEGAEWEIYTSKRLSLSGNLLLGLAVTSHNENKTSTAVFRELSVN